jgi:hypothetical protein
MSQKDFPIDFPICIECGEEMVEVHRYGVFNIEEKDKKLIYSSQECRVRTRQLELKKLPNFRS